MASISTKAVGLAAAGAAVAAIGLGVAQVARADDPSSTPTPSATATQGDAGKSADGPAGAPAPGKAWGPGGRHGGGMGMGKGLGGGANLATLATTLGVDEAKLKDAIKAVRDQQKAARQSSGSTTKPDPAAMQDEFATKLAAELGLDSAKVKKALADLRAAEQAEHQKAFDDKLAKAVTDGTLTQAEADAVKKAAKAGIIGMGRPR